MFKLPRQRLLLLTLFFGLLFLPTSALAKDDVETVVIGPDEVFSGDHFAGAESIIFSGRVEGDLYLGGGAVTFDGETGGDLLIGGGKVTVRGRVGQSLRVVGGQVTVDSQVGRNLLVVGGDLEVSDQTAVAGSLVAAGGNIEESGIISLGGNIFGGRVYMDGTFGGDLHTVAGEELLFGPSAQITGIAYQAPKQLTLSDGLVSGETVYSAPTEAISEWAGPRRLQKTWDRVPGGSWRRAGRLMALPFRVAWLAAAFLLGLLLINLFPEFSLNVVKALEESPGKSLGWGVLGGFVFPISLVLLVISLVGIMLIPLWGLVLGVSLFSVKVLGPLAIGHYVLLRLANEDRRGWALLIGLLISFVLGFVPAIGRIYGLLLSTATLGAITTSIFHRSGKKTRRGRAK